MQGFDPQLLQGLTKGYVPFVIPKNWAARTVIDMPPIRDRIVQLGEHYDSESGCTIEHIFEIKTPCLLWTGWNDGKKGDNAAHGKFKEKGKSIFVHRRSFELANNRALNDDEVVDHLCRRGLCWNCTHLEAVTVALNTARGNGRFYQYKQAKLYG